MPQQNGSGLGKGDAGDAGEASATRNLLLFSGRSGWSRNASTLFVGFEAPGIELASSRMRGFVISVRGHIANIVVPSGRFTQQEAAMFPMVRAYRDARILSRKLRKSLAAPDDKWKVGTDEDGYPMLSSGDFRILLVPRAVRFLGAIHVYSNDAEIWLPLFARLRLRAAARLRLIQDANEHWEESDLRKTRARRKRAKPAA
jgi:hypothetical protein